ncbi:MAG: xanthine dehydrogenase family protein molybdopterin-binding subunit [Alphaproteobacteria bacterium]|nr:MAG: xanthine dehydrogenase family protein molybdopterin-binding subunit [Alphaproteobacteria bacterium]
MVKLTRRGFLVGGAALGGTLAAGMAIGVGFLSTVDTNGLDGTVLADGTLQLNAWVQIRPDGHIIFAVPRSEMGQGIHTALPMLIAEELEVSLDADNVSVIFPQEPLPVYANFMLGLRQRPEDATGAASWLGRKIFGLVPYILTGGSSSTADGFVSMRRAGAAARSMLIKAAAGKWGTGMDGLYAEDGYVINPASGARLSYGALATDAAGMEPDRDPVLKPAKDFRLVGKAIPRLDIPAKVRGQARFGIDTVLDDMLIGVVVQPEVFGSRVARLDDTAALALPRVHKVVNMGDAVGVIADTYYHAKKAADVLEVEFSNDASALVSDSDIAAVLEDALNGEKAYVQEDEGDLAAAFAAGETVEARYATPYLAHACMETMNCTAVVQDGAAELWMPSQTPLAMKWAAGDLDLPNGIIFNTTLAGGAFGRRSEKDVAVHALRMAAAVPGRPVKAIWPREEDIRHDVYRPAARARIRAAVGADGMPTGFDFRIAVQSPMEGFTRRNAPFTQNGDGDAGVVEGAVHHPYALGARRVENATVRLPVPVGFWRSVGHSNNGFFVESFIDELAHRAGQDPMAYRRALLAHDPRLAAIMDTLADLSAWHTPPAEGIVRGVAFHPSFLSYVAQVAEVRVNADKSLKVERVYCVVDCGQTVNPDTVKAQMEGGIIFGLSALMHGEINIEAGAVVQSNFPDYDMVRMADAPDIIVHVMENSEAPGGVGEPGVPPVFAAVTNAIFAANGERIRSLPIRNHGYAFTS